MSEIRVEKEVTGKSSAVFKKLRTYCDKKLILKSLGNLKPKVDWSPKKKMGSFHEKGVEGKIQVAGNEPSVISISMEIPFFLLPFKNVIRESIQNHLDNFS